MNDKNDNKKKNSNGYDIDDSNDNDDHFSNEKKNFAANYNNDNVIN